MMMPDSWQGYANNAQRVLDVMTEDERLCDWQASFLIEVLSQYRARRAAKNLSSRFETMYQKVALCYHRPSFR